MKHIIFIVLIVFGITSNAIAQRGHNEKSGKLEHLKTKLELTDEQAEELKDIFETVREDETRSRKDKKAEMDKAVVEILTPEQLIKFNELKSNRGRGFGKRGKFRKKHMKRDFIKDDETRIRLSEMRKELDASISPDDKVLISELRQTFAKRRAEKEAKRNAFKDLSDEEKKAEREQRKQNRKEANPDHEKAMVLVNKYKEEINTLFEENKEFFEEKKAARKAEFRTKKGKHKDLHKKKEECKDEDGDKKLCEKTDDNRVKGKHHKHRRHRKGKHHSKELRFLLMDPDKVQNDKIKNRAEERIQGIKEIATNSISVSPNPASSLINITYEVKERSPIKVEIRDELGRTLEVIVDEVLESGIYYKSVATDNYVDQTYYISILDGKTIATEKLIIQK